MLSVIKGCPHLKVLKLQCINLTDDTLNVAGTSCLSLELLALYSFQRFTDKWAAFSSLLFRICFIWLRLNSWIHKQTHALGIVQIHIYLIFWLWSTICRIYQFKRAIQIFLIFLKFCFLIRSNDINWSILSNLCSGVRLDCFCNFFFFNFPFTWSLRVQPFSCVHLDTIFFHVPNYWFCILIIILSIFFS